MDRDTSINPHPMIIQWFYNSWHILGKRNLIHDQTWLAPNQPNFRGDSIKESPGAERSPWKSLGRLQNSEPNEGLEWERAGKGILEFQPDFMECTFHGASTFPLGSIPSESQGRGTSGILWQHPPSQIKPGCVRIPTLFSPGDHDPGAMNSLERCQWSWIRWQRCLRGEATWNNPKK